jgi:hypothetical protein
MTKTITYLEEKNMFLEKFMGINREWLDRLSRGDFNKLEEFRENRENILNIIKHLDVLVDAHSRKMDGDEIPDIIKHRLNALLERKDALVKVILSQDLEIMELVENAKSQIIVELQNVRKTRKTIGSYKSTNKVKETVDEEA